MQDAAADADGLLRGDGAGGFRGSLQNDGGRLYAARGARVGAAGRGSLLQHAHLRLPRQWHGWRLRAWWEGGRGGCGREARAPSACAGAAAEDARKRGVRRATAPLPAPRSQAAGNAAGFFRVVPGFVVQFGISGLPAISGAWQPLEIKDDPVVLSNLAGSIAFATAGPDTRTTQLFINLGNNAGLDGQGFAPFGNVTSDAGYKVIQNIYSGYAQTPDQDSIYAQGDAYLLANFPKLDYIIAAVVAS